LAVVKSVHLGFGNIPPRHAATHIYIYIQQDTLVTISAPPYYVVAPIN